MKLTANVREDHLVVVVAEGTITRDDLDELPADFFEAALGPGWVKKKLLLNMQDISFMDSMGIGWLLDLNRKCKNGEGKLVLFGLQPRVRQMVTLLNLDSVLAIAANETLACAIATGEAKGAAK